LAKKAVFLDYATVGPGLDLAALKSIFPALEIFEATADAEVAERIRNAAFVFANKVKLSESVLRDASELRFIGLTATGVDNVDLQSASTHGIAVCNIRGYCTQSVTEHVFGVLLMLSHNLHRYAASVKAGEWQHATDFCMLDFPIRELSAMTMGIVGHGELGSGVARMARDFGMQVLVSARPGDHSVSDDRVPFDKVLQQSDVISLHCPLDEHTEGLFGAAQFQRMRSDSILINTARGALVDSIALVAALQNGDIAGAAVDVLPTEPPVDGNPLLDYRGENLIVTPHIAWATDEARQGAINELAANVVAFLDGRERNRVV
jgi:glycerate dehydrogenase